MKKTPLLLALVAAILSAPAAAQTPEGRINVLGRGVVERAPDHASIQVGLSSKGPTPTATIDANSAAISRVIAFAKQSGVEVRDIRTSSVNLSETFRSVTEPSGRSRQEPDGYTASNTVAVILRELPRLGRFMREVLDQGANRISGVTFGLNNPAEAGDIARSAAMEDAKRKALRLAETANVKLGRILRIDHPPRAEYRSVPDGAADLPVRRGLSMAVPIEAGVIEISAEVDVSWATE